MKKDKRFISGIYNYCDYWCERCEFTRRCRNFEMGREIERRADNEKAPDDAANAKFWSHLASKARDAAMSVGSESWQPDDWEDADFDIDPEWQAREDARRAAVNRHPLVVTAYEYLQRTTAWLESADPDLKEVARDLLDAAGSRFHDSNYEEDALEIGELLEVVSWYHTLIPPKLGRAVGGLLEHNNPEPGSSDIVLESRLSDANGSGKIALVAVERSISAWLRLREILPAQEDAILELLSLLGRIQNGIHAVLPGVKTFFRPGFDGEPPDDEG